VHINKIFVDMFLDECCHFMGHYAECHYHYGDGCFVDYRYGKFYNDEFHYAECHYAVGHYPGKHFAEW
jgi:hypothetical protein